MRTLTGIQPSGILHLGNYLGAMQPAIAAQDEAGTGDCYYFIADYHSMTSLLDPQKRRDYSRGVAIDWLACGLDPAKSVLWRQSDVPEVCELAWLLGTLAPMGLLERAHSFKDKTSRGIAANVGLFTYPVLMAADILLYDTTHVPVGRDQKQHVEMTRDMAIKFNLTYGETFVVPESVIRDESAVVPGLDGQKMSKSYGNTLELFGDEKATRKKIMGIPMDSRSPAEPKPDADQNIAIRLLKTVATPALAAETEAHLSAGGLGYGDLKKILFEQVWAHFAAARVRRAELAADPGHIDAVLREGAQRARAEAVPVMERARRACGLR
ncbi:MAG: tryptophan--tRNA ligase [Verrucomicrobia bacterium]|nr:MAG: tryptophan--tRNA ligase [Verrucomicrobiota bacterium]